MKKRGEKTNYPKNIVSPKTSFCRHLRFDPENLNNIKFSFVGVVGELIKGKVFLFGPKVKPTNPGQVRRRSFWAGKKRNFKNKLGCLRPEPYFIWGTKVLAGD